MVRQDDQDGKNGTQGVLDRANVIWAVWSDGGETPKVRVIRGRELTGPDLRHGVLELEYEVEALVMGVRWGDKIGLRPADQKLDIPQPAVPPHLIGLLMSDPVLLYDGSEMEFVCPFEAEGA